MVCCCNMLSNWKQVRCLKTTKKKKINMKWRGSVMKHDPAESSYAGVHYGSIWMQKKFWGCGFAPINMHNYFYMRTFLSNYIKWLELSYHTKRSFSRDIHFDIKQCLLSEGRVWMHSFFFFNSACIYGCTLNWVKKIPSKINNNCN